MKLSEAARAIKSANAGATLITVDISFADTASYERVLTCRELNSAAIAGVYGVDPAKVEIYGYHPSNTIKITFPRTAPSGGVQERDFDGVQQYVPLLNLEVCTD
jgi:hypothetical protein